MGCIQSLIRESVKCECSHIPYKELAVKPENCTPLDRLGFPQRCCWCCSLRVASIVICFISFIWAGILLQSADKSMAAVFPERGAAFKYFKGAYLLLCVSFILASAALLVGILIRKEKPILVYVWYAFIFNCTIIMVIIIGAVSTIINQGHVGRRHAAQAVMALIWSTIFIYLLMVVNSYKLAVWYLTLGFGVK